MTIRIPSRRRGMELLRDACIAQSRENIAYTTPASGRRSPHMNNEEPIAMSTYPDARPLPPSEPAKIDRDDFPAPPYYYADPERRRRYSASSSKSKGSETLEEDADDLMLDAAKAAELAKEEERIRREAEELKKTGTGIGKVFLQNIEERSKVKHERFRHGIDPRNASRSASAKSEPHVPTRYGSPAFACELTA